MSLMNHTPGSVILALLTEMAMIGTQIPTSSMKLRAIKDYRDAAGCDLLTAKIVIEAATGTNTYVLDNQALRRRIYEVEAANEKLENVLSELRDVIKNF